MTIAEFQQRFISTMQQVIVGHDRPVHELLVALLCRGHVLLEGVPGIAKTLLAKSLARCMALQFGRVQFTPDLMPSDVIGTNVFNFETRQFVLVKGPVFTDILLCDEINRTPPKTQAALLESMEERQATIDGKPYPLSDEFFVVATQNPLEHEGTYPLPEAQLDRFFMKINMKNPSQEQMKEILTRFTQEPDQQKRLLQSMQPLLTPDVLLLFRQAVFSVTVAESVLSYVASLHAESQVHPGLSAGVSARASLHLLLAARAQAAIQGRDFVTPDDVRAMAYPVLCHRLVRRPEVEFEGTTTKQILSQIFERLSVPK